MISKAGFEVSGSKEVRELCAQMPSLMFFGLHFGFGLVLLLFVLLKQFYIARLGLTLVLNSGSSPHPQPHPAPSPTRHAGITMCVLAIIPSTGSRFEKGS